MKQRFEALEQQDTTTGREQPTPTAERRPSRPEPGFPSEAESAAGQDSISPQVPKTTIPPEAPLPGFAPSGERILSSGTTMLRRGGDGVYLAYWNTILPSVADIVFTEAGLVGRQRTELGLLAEGSDTSFATCRDHIGWAPIVSRQQMRRGSFSCLRWNSYRGILRIDAIPDPGKKDRPGENVPAVVITGHVWNQPVGG